MYKQMNKSILLGSIKQQPRFCNKWKWETEKKSFEGPKQLLVVAPQTLKGWETLR